jgi:hypothetical protein
MMRKLKYMVMSREQNAEQQHNIKTGNISFECVLQLKHLGKTHTYHNTIREDINSRMIPGNAWYHSVHNLWPSSLLSKPF